MSDARIPGFYRLDPKARHDQLKARFGLTAEELLALQDGLSLERADKMVENCVGVFGLPIGLGLNFLINGQDYVVPMVVEEPSVVAAASHIARLVREHGGFAAEADRGVMIAQVQLLDCPDPDAARAAILAHREALVAKANAVHPNMAARGAGALDIEVKVYGEPYPMLVVHLLVDCADAMGANALNSMAEGVAPELAALTGGRAGLRILSNLADRRLARASFRLPESALTCSGFEGVAVAEGIVQAWRFAEIDPYRAATHNKGIMNGIDAVALATGNDWRSVEAGAHAYACRDGAYRSLSRFWREGGCLCGALELPLAVGTVGGSTQVHPGVAVLRKLLGADSARTLAAVMAAVGLAQNTGALRALATEGIQRGHMSLHARSVALAAGATPAEVEPLAAKLLASGRIKDSVARVLLDELRR